MSEGDNMEVNGPSCGHLRDHVFVVALQVGQVGYVGRGGISGG